MGPTGFSLCTEMKLSEAILAGRAYAETEYFHEYFRFSPTNSLAAKDVAADALFAAYLGKYTSGGLAQVVGALHTQGPQPRTRACHVITDGLLRAWPELGARPEGKRRTALLEAAAGLARPISPLETLMGYIANLSRERYDRTSLSKLLEKAGL